MLSNHLLFCRPLLLLPSVVPSIRDFSTKSAVHIRWSKYRNFSFSVSLSSEYSESISLKIDWFDLFAAQGNCMSLLQHHHSKASILWHSAFSQPCLTMGKTIALTTWIFVDWVMSLLFNTLSRSPCRKSLMFFSSLLTPHFSPSLTVWFIGRRLGVLSWMPASALGDKHTSRWTQPQQCFPCWICLARDRLSIKLLPHFCTF